jgi:hypothetical protein
VELRSGFFDVVAEGRGIQLVGEAQKHVHWKVQLVLLRTSVPLVNANRNALLGGGALIGGNNGEIEYTGDYGPYDVPDSRSGTR